MIDHDKERRINLAIAAIRSVPPLSVRKAGRIYGIPRSTLALRMAGRQPQSETTLRVRRFSVIEEDIIVQYVLDLDSRGFPPSLSTVEDMANHLVALKGERHVGKHWVEHFLNRCTELKTCFNRVYDYKRALNEDPALISKWFELFKSTKDEYGILDDDVWNFDETGFMMGMIHPYMVVTKAERVGRAKSIQPGNRDWATAIVAISAGGEVIPPYLLVKGVIVYTLWVTTTGWPISWPIKPTENGWTNDETGLDWIQHFDKHTAGLVKGIWRLLVLDGHSSHMTVAFHEYCTEYKIKVLCLPPHSSHLTQPADVGLFQLLKRVYGLQIDELMKASQTHIAKEDFLAAFRRAFAEAITEKNSKAGFRAAGLVPFDPQEVISKLDIRLRTPSPSTPSSSPPWTSQTPQDPKGTLAQTDLIRKRINRHQSSSPSPLFRAALALAKGAERMANEVVLLEADNHRLRRVNQELSKRRRAPRIEMARNTAITTEEAEAFLAERELNAQNTQNRVATDGDGPSQSRCSLCHNAGHNKRTCPNRLIDPALDSCT
ncbi:DDE superfamily endonuclease protein [Rutstroemia sp. NJR-2017a WRK4]|nr:DDE superfamily endonuclease protein [Rutstroemia sp. NJR-2017a WRK4]